MKDAIKERLDWVSGSLAVQIVFFAVASAACIKGLSSGHNSTSAPLYLTVSLVLLVVTVVNAIVSFGFLRHFLGLLFILATCFVMPFSLNAYGVGLGLVAFCGMLYAIAVIAISPRYVGGATLLASIAFACYLHYDSVVFRKLPVFEKDLAALERSRALEGDDALRAKGVKFYKVPREMGLKEISSIIDVYGDPEKAYYLYIANKSRLEALDKSVQSGTVLIVPSLPKVEPIAYIKLGLWFVAGALLAFCWRLLVGKMSDLFKLSMNNSSKATQRQIDEINAQLDATRKEYRVLKEEVSLQIIEMNKITGFKK